MERSAPIDASSGEHVRHRLSRAGNRRINAHCTSWRSSSCATRPKAAPTTTPKSRRETPMEAMRCLKRRLSDLVYRQMLNDALTPEKVTGPGGQRGNDSDSSATGSQPQHRHFGQATPGPVNNQPKPALPKVS